MKITPPTDKDKNQLTFSVFKAGSKCGFTRAIRSKKGERGS